MSLIMMAVVGLVVGLVARAVMPGTQSMGLILTSVLGIAGSYVAGFLGQAVGLYRAGEGAGFLGSVVGALVLLLVVGFMQKRSGGDSAGSV
jgi:uncharacterized membrane protein YeaQ/YmgE (transglycosylase-associated protein family)